MKILILLILYSCTNKPIDITKEGNFDVEFLFEKDNCKIYRFYDAGRNIYWSNCAGNIQYNYIRNQFSTDRMQSFTNK